MTRVVLDTNVVISAILARGLPYLVGQLALGRIITCVISPDLLDEYRLTILKPRFLKIRAEGKAILRELEKRSVLVHPKSHAIDFIQTDPSDNHVLMCAVAGSADYVITGDRKHFAFHEFQGIRIVTPREFVDEVGGKILG